MNVLIVLLVVTFTISQANSLSQLEDWRNFKFQHGKKYKNEVEDKVRMKIFQQNKQKIKMHNAQYKKGLVSYEQGINKYCDMLPFEFVKTFNGFNRTGTRAYHKNVIGKKFSMPADENLPDAVDWREKGAVTPVKDQQRCGACWAFASTGALEGQEFIKKGKLISLSEQNLIDCSKKYGNNGCDGGLMDNSFTYIKDNDGIDTEKSYPYEARDGECRYNLKNSAADDTGFIDLDAGDEKKLMAAVATVGPIAVGIDASHESLQRYKRGIYYEPNCSSTDLDHAVLVVGYGVDENNKKYWIVKNSWSRSWGEGGYFKMPRDENNYCSIATAPSYPIV